MFGLFKSKDKAKQVDLAPIEREPYLEKTIESENFIVYKVFCTKNSRLDGLELVKSIKGLRICGVNVTRFSTEIICEKIRE